VFSLFFCRSGYPTKPPPNKVFDGPRCSFFLLSYFYQQKKIKIKKFKKKDATKHTPLNPGRRVEFFSSSSFVSIGKKNFVVLIPYLDF